ncbi:hypothetical protein [Pajaroellobacter abortibovis]|nr:hypothetical protein [Pajaroellobacter abortibovis]
MHRCAGITFTREVLGSPACMAPEQIKENARSDIFSLEVVFYENVVGHLPFEGNNSAQLLRRILNGVYSLADQEQERPIVGRRWGAIVGKAFAHQTGQQFENAIAMRKAIV